jgi:hypothetical protein
MDKGKFVVSSLDVDESGAPVRFICVPGENEAAAQRETLLNGSPGPAFCLDVDAAGVGRFVPAAPGKEN